MDYRIKEIIAKVENDLPHPLVISELAASLNMSVSYFQHLFKKEVQTSITKYITNRRLEKARELLETSHLRIQEVRLKVGASSEAQFFQDFKAKFGETPTEYRKNFRNSRDA